MCAPNTPSAFAFTANEQIILCPRSPLARANTASPRLPRAVARVTLCSPCCYCDTPYCRVSRLSSATPSACPIAVLSSATPAVCPSVASLLPLLSLSALPLSIHWYSQSHKGCGLPRTLLVMFRAPAYSHPHPSCPLPGRAVHAPQGRRVSATRTMRHLLHGGRYRPEHGMRTHALT
jgi:hypothetical protein